MNIKECAWCGKAIYGDDYYVGTGGYYHKDCQSPNRGGGNDTPPYVEGGIGGSGGDGEVIVMPSGDFSDIGLLKAENARLKEALKELCEEVDFLVKGNWKPRVETQIIHKRVGGLIGKEYGTKY